MITQNGPEAWEAGTPDPQTAHGSLMSPPLFRRKTLKIFLNA